MVKKGAFSFLFPFQECIIEKTYNDGQLVTTLA